MSDNDQEEYAMTQPPDGLPNEGWPNREHREQCERFDIPTNMTLAEREQVLAGGAKRAAHADLVVRLYPDGTYRIFKNRASSAPFTQQSCVIYVGGENIIPFPLRMDVEAELTRRPSSR